MAHVKTTVDRMYSFWRTWFSQPESVRLQHLRTPGKGGYYPLASESPGFSGRPDSKHYFHFRWPLHSHLDDATEEVFYDCYERARDWLIDHNLAHLNFDPRRCVLRILHYLPTTDGCAGEAHKDFDLLTVSVPGTVPGLEVFDPCGQGIGTWHLQESGIQVGEMLEIYTNPDGYPNPSACMGQLRATLHRVRTPPNVERYKAVFFYLPPNDFELRPGFTAGDYLRTTLTKAGTAGVGVK